MSMEISQAALDLYRDSEVFDLHNDLYVPARLLRYDPGARHEPGLFGARFFYQTDLPRIREAGLSGLTFDIVTNPVRTSASRAPATLRNIARIQSDLAKLPGEYRFVQSHSEYLAARAEGLTACYIGIQGGQAFQHSRETLDAIPDAVHRITLVHLTNSRIGITNSPLASLKKGPLSTRGDELVEVMNARRILVDLAHINRAGYMHAVEIHDKTQPLICTHTGVTGVQPHWRNIDDEQIRAVANTGGVIGIVFHSMFLSGIANWRRGPVGRILDHMEHVVNVAGERAVAIGTDYDGAIVPPIEVQQVTDLPVLVELMLRRDWPEARIRGVLGANALRTLEAIRP